MPFVWLQVEGDGIVLGAHLMSFGEFAGIIEKEQGTMTTHNHSELADVGMTMGTDVGPTFQTDEDSLHRFIVAFVHDNVAPFAGALFGGLEHVRHLLVGDDLHQMRILNFSPDLTL